METNSKNRERERERACQTGEIKRGEGEKGEQWEERKGACKVPLVFWRGANERKKDGRGSS